MVHSVNHPSVHASPIFSALCIFYDYEQVVGPTVGPNPTTSWLHNIGASFQSWTHGQLYVALLHGTTSSDIVVLLPSDSVDFKTNNIVCSNFIGITLFDIAPLAIKIHSST
jgi:hypothetical protein